MIWGKAACRYLISQYPEVESKILAELEGLELLKTAQNPKPREMTYADLSKLTYLNAAIKVCHLSHARLLTTLLMRAALLSEQPTLPAAALSLASCSERNKGGHNAFVYVGP